MNPALLGLLRGLGMVVLAAVINFLADSTNLQGVVTPTVATLISVVALALEHMQASSTGKALFGAVKM